MFTPTFFGRICIVHHERGETRRQQKIIIKISLEFKLKSV